MPEELAVRLEHLAKATDRSRSYLATLAIEEFVAVQEWQIEAIQDGIKAGRIVPHEKAVAHLKTWGR
jgi:RHH-type transcriptional regulator, rel operon repressor / antitoxin RelB